MNQLGLEAVLGGISSDPDMQALFGGSETLAKVRDAQRLAGDARARLAAAVAALAATPDGIALFDYLIGAYVRRFNNITALGLPMETAIQLHAERDGQRELVHDLLRLVNEGRAQASTKRG